MTALTPIPNDPIDADSLRALTAAMHEFVTAKGWYVDDSKRPQTPRSLAISLAIEAAEVLEHFQWGDLPDDETARAALAGELADVLLYLMQIASLSGIDLGQAAIDKLRLNANRRWD